MAAITLTGRVEASPDKVWDVFTDLDRAAERVDGIVRLEHGEIETSLLDHPRQLVVMAPVTRAKAQDGERNAHRVGARLLVADDEDLVHGAGAATARTERSGPPSLSAILEQALRPRCAALK